MDEAVYREIDRSSAHNILTSVLHTDLAYGVESMPLVRATELACQFIELFEEARYYTNGLIPRQAPCGWNPATQATFDTGVLVIGRVSSGCLWVEDED